MGVIYSPPLRLPCVCLDDATTTTTTAQQSEHDDDEPALDIDSYPACSRLASRIPCLKIELLLILLLLPPLTAAGRGRISSRGPFYSVHWREREREREAKNAPTQNYLLFGEGAPICISA